MWLKFRKNTASTHATILPALESIKILVFQQRVPFHVTEERLPLPGDGTIGVKFLRRAKAEISFLHNTIMT